MVTISRAICYIREGGLWRTTVSQKGKLKAVSLFSGCGGFDWGASQAGIEIVWANDIDAHAAAAYQSLFPDVEFVFGDVRDVKIFPKADVLIGCYPCTGFSVGSRRKWHNRKKRDLTTNPDNYLFLEFLRAIRQVRPKYLFVENVPGMASANDGWFLEAQKDGFKKLGYRVVHKRLDAVDFGVPQNRKRIFIVGVLDESRALRYEFPEPSHGPEGKRPIKALKDVIGGWDLWPEGEYLDYPFPGHYLTRNRKRGWSEPSYTIVANAYHIPLHPMGEPMSFVEKDTWKLNGKKNRRLSWRECAALQGLPGSTAPSGGLRKKHRVVGNAVPPALGKALLEPVVEFEEAAS